MSTCSKSLPEQALSERWPWDVSLESICYDGTNFYTFIDTFNARCDLPRRGKNKQGRANLRQVSYALFCCEDGQLPLFYDVYEGNRNDAKQFPRMLQAFHAFLKEVTGRPAPLPETTIIFDKGNNSRDNFELVDEWNRKFVGSVKLDEHKDLAGIPNDDPRFVACGNARLERTKAFRVRKTVYGQERTVVVTYNQNLFDAQWQTVQNDLAKALEQLSALSQRLEDRRTGVVRGGQAPTRQSVEKQCREALRRQHLKPLVRWTIDVDENDLPRLKYQVDTKALDRLANTYLGKNILITNRDEWSEERIILAYRSQFLIEDVFKEMKDRRSGTWWPLNHWTDSKVRVHALLLHRGHPPAWPASAQGPPTGDRPLDEAPAERTGKHPRGRQRVSTQARPAHALPADGVDPNERHTRSFAVDLGPPKARGTRFRVTAACVQPPIRKGVRKTPRDNL